MLKQIVLTVGPQPSPTGSRRDSFSAETNNNLRFPGLSVIFSTLLLALLSSACSGLSSRLPPANLGAPGWISRQGQAVWRIPSGTEIAGEVLVATGPNAQSLVQFSKTPFPILIGQTSGKHWQVELPTQKKSYAGPGAPPKRLIWLYLPRAILGQPLPAHWDWKQTGSTWRLVNHKTGEAIEGFFDQ